MFLEDLLLEELLARTNIKSGMRQSIMIKLIGIEIVVVGKAILSIALTIIIAIMIRKMDIVEVKQMLVEIMTEIPQNVLGPMTIRWIIEK